MENNTLNIQEIRTIILLSLIFAFRMLSIFIILPIITVYGIQLKHANEFLIGLAMGIYGLVQAILQIPLGFLSDKIGHKKVIFYGLILFFLGSITVAITHDIWGLILGRALQGSGAISASILALLFQLIREQHITKSMAFIGSSFGLMFAIAIVLGPIIINITGLNGLFFIISLITLFSIGLLFLIPKQKLNSTTVKIKKIIFKDILNLVISKKFIKLNVSILLLHTMLMSNFIVWPLMLIKVGISSFHQWRVYLAVMLLSILVVIPSIIYSEKKKIIKNLFLLSILLIGISEFILIFNNKVFEFLFIGIQLFFISFSIMETILPSMISKISPINYKGTIMSIYTTHQFLGVAFGGIIGGIIFQLYGSKLVFCFNLLISIIWYFIIKKI